MKAQENYLYTNEYNSLTKYIFYNEHINNISYLNICRDHFSSTNLLKNLVQDSFKFVDETTNIDDKLQVLNDIFNVFNLRNNKNLYNTLNYNKYNDKINDIMNEMFEQRYNQLIEYINKIDNIQQKEMLNNNLHKLIKVLNFNNDRITDIYKNMYEHYRQYSDTLTLIYNYIEHISKEDSEYELCINYANYIKKTINQFYKLKNIDNYDILSMLNNLINLHKFLFMPENKFINFIDDFSINNKDLYYLNSIYNINMRQVLKKDINDEDKKEFISQFIFNVYKNFTKIYKYEEYKTKLFIEINKEISKQGSYLISINFDDIYNDRRENYDNILDDILYIKDINDKTETIYNKLLDINNSISDDLDEEKEITIDIVKSYVSIEDIDKIYNNLYELSILLFKNNINNIYKEYDEEYSTLLVDEDQKLMKIPNIFIIQLMINLLYNNELLKSVNETYSKIKLDKDTLILLLTRFHSVNILIHKSKDSKYYINFIDPAQYRGYSVKSSYELTFNDVSLSMLFLIMYPKYTESVFLQDIIHIPYKNYNDHLTRQIKHRKLRIYPFAELMQEAASCFFFSSLYSICTFVYLHKDELEFKLYKFNEEQNNIIENKDIINISINENDLFDIKDYCIIDEDGDYIMLKNMIDRFNVILYYLYYVAYIDFVTKFDYSIIMKKDETNNLTYNNYVYSFLNRVIKSYTEFYDKYNKEFIPDSINSIKRQIIRKYPDTPYDKYIHYILIKPDNYIRCIQELYKKILNNTVNENKVLVYINKNKIDNNSYLDNINGINNKFYLYKKMSETLQYISSNYTSEIDSDKLFYIQLCNNLYQFNYDDYINGEICVKYNNYNLSSYPNSLIPLAFTYNQMLDIMLIKHVNINDDSLKKILDFDTIVQNIYDGFNSLLLNKFSRENYLLLNKTTEDYFLNNDKPMLKNYSYLKFYLNNLCKLLYETPIKIEQSALIKNSSTSIIHFKSKEHHNIYYWIKNNLFEYRKLFIHKFIVLYHFLNIQITSNIISLIDKYLILNIIKLFYYHYIFYIIASKPGFETRPLFFYIDNIENSSSLINVFYNYVYQDLEDDEKENVLKIHRNLAFLKLCDFNAFNFSIMNKRHDIFQQKINSYFNNSLIEQQLLSNYSIDSKLHNNTNLNNSYYIKQFIIMIIIDLVKTYNTILKNIKSDTSLSLEQKQTYIKMYCNNIDINRYLTKDIKIIYGGEIQQKFIINVIIYLQLWFNDTFEEKINYSDIESYVNLYYNTNNASIILKLFNRYINNQIDSKRRNIKKTLINDIFEEIKDIKVNYTNTQFFDQLNLDPIKTLCYIMKLYICSFYTKIYKEKKDYKYVEYILNDFTNKDRTRTPADEIQNCSNSILRYNYNYYLIILKLEQLDKYIKGKPTNFPLLLYSYINHVVKPSNTNINFAYEYSINKSKDYVYYKSYISNVFTLFTKIYKDIVNKTSLEDIIKVDLLNIVGSMIKSNNEFNFIFNNEDTTNIKFNNIEYIKDIDVSYYKLHEFKYAEIMYSLFSKDINHFYEDNKLKDDEIIRINKLLKEDIFIDKQLKDVNYCYNQSLIWSNKENFINELFSKITPDQKRIFNKNIMDYVIDNDNNKNHYIILLVLYLTGILNSDIITPETINKLKEIYKDNYDIMLLLNDKIEIQSLQNYNINLYKKEFDIFNKLNEEEQKNILPRVNIQCDNMVKKEGFDYYLTVNKSKYKFNNIRKLKIFLNQTVYNNNCYIFINEDDDVYITIPDKLVNNNNLYFHINETLNEEELIFDIDKVFINNVLYNIIKPEECNNVYSNLHSSLILHSSNKYYILLYNYTCQSGFYKNIVYLNKPNIRSTYNDNPKYNNYISNQTTGHLIKNHDFELFELTSNLLSFKVNNYNQYENIYNTLSDLEFKLNNILNDPFYRIDKKSTYIKLKYMLYNRLEYNIPLFNYELHSYINEYYITTNRNINIEYSRIGQPTFNSNIINDIINNVYNIVILLENYYINNKIEKIEEIKLKDTDYIKSINLIKIRIHNIYNKLNYNFKLGLINNYYEFIKHNLYIYYNLLYCRSLCNNILELINENLNINETVKRLKNINDIICLRYNLFINNINNINEYIEKSKCNSFIIYSFKFDDKYIKKNREYVSDYIGYSNNYLFKMSKKYKEYFIENEYINDDFDYKIIKERYERNKEEIDRMNREFGDDEGGIYSSEDEGSKDYSEDEDDSNGSFGGNYRIKLNKETNKLRNELIKKYKRYNGGNGEIFTFTEGETIKPAKKPAEDPAEDPAKKLAKKPAEDPAKKPAKKPAEDPAKKPAKKPAEDPAKKPAEDPAKKPAYDFRDHTDALLVEPLDKVHDYEPEEETQDEKSYYDNIYYNEFQKCMFEIFFDNFIRPSQLTIIEKIYNEIVKVNNDNSSIRNYKIKNLIMGGGKTSVLTPILTMLIELKGLPFIIILPDHLVKDSINTLLQYRILYIRNLRYVHDMNNINSFVIDPQYNYILSDTQFKYWIMMMNNNSKDVSIVLQQFYILYDEIDTLLDPTKSNFNKITANYKINDYINKKNQFLYNIYLKELYNIYYISYQIKLLLNKELIKSITTSISNESIEIKDVINIDETDTTFDYNLIQKDILKELQDNKSIILEYLQPKIIKTLYQKYNKLLNIDVSEITEPKLSRDKQEDIYNIIKYIYKYSFKDIINEKIISKMKDIKQEYDKHYINIIDNNLNDAYKYIKTLEYNINYGFSLTETHNTKFIGVPYKFLNTPIKNSYFTNINQTIIATLLSYIYQYNNIRECDYINYLKIDNNTYINITDKKIQIQSLEDTKHKLQDINIYYNYIIHNIITNIKQTVSYSNVSGVDIIGNNISLIKTAYSGTVNFNLPLLSKISYSKLTETSNTKLKQPIKKEDVNCPLSVIDNNKVFINTLKFEATILKEDNSNKNIADKYEFNQIDDPRTTNENIKEGLGLLKDISDKIRIESDFMLSYGDQEIFNYCSIIENGDLKYTALIDASALLKNYTLYDTIKKLYVDINRNLKANKIDKQYIIVFVDENDYKKIYYKLNDKEVIETFIKPEKNYFYYYDNRHIVGTDIKQLDNINGLITVNYNSTFTVIAQAAYRLRRLNSTHSISYIFNIKNINNYQKYITLIEECSNKENSYITKINRLFEYLNKTESTQKEFKKYLIEHQINLLYYKLLDKNMYNMNNVNNLFINDNNTIKRLNNNDDLYTESIYTDPLLKNYIIKVINKDKVSYIFGRDNPKYTLNILENKTMLNISEITTQLSIEQEQEQDTEIDELIDTKFDNELQNITCNTFFNNNIIYKIKDCYILYNYDNKLRQTLRCYINNMKKYVFIDLFQLLYLYCFDSKEIKYIYQFDSKEKNKKNITINNNIDIYSIFNFNNINNIMVLRFLMDIVNKIDNTIKLNEIVDETIKNLSDDKKEDFKEQLKNGEIKDLKDVGKLKINILELNRLIKGQINIELINNMIDIVINKYEYHSLYIENNKYSFNKLNIETSVFLQKFIDDNYKYLLEIHELNVSKLEKYKYQFPLLVYNINHIVYLNTIKKLINETKISNNNDYIKLKDNIEHYIITKLQKYCNIEVNIENYKQILNNYYRI